MITMYDVPSFRQLIDERWTAVALLYGKPPSNFSHYCSMTVVPLAFRMMLEKVFDPEEVHRVGLRRMAHDYYEWYTNNEHHEGQIAQGHSALPG